MTFAFVSCFNMMNVDLAFLSLAFLDYFLDTKLLFSCLSPFSTFTVLAECSCGRFWG